MAEALLISRNDPRPTLWQCCRTTRNGCGPLIEPVNYCCESGVLLLKAKIEDYWRARGFDVQVRVMEAGFHPAIRSARFDLRSDMRNGLPVRAIVGANAPAPEAVSLSSNRVQDFASADADA